MTPRPDASREPRAGRARVAAFGVALVAASSLAVAACFAAPEPAARAREPQAELPCEACELVFAGMPESPPAQARIAPAGEPGEPMRIDGVVFDRAGKPAPGVIVYAYHTDATGVYPRAPVRHGRLRGWAASDAEGRYRFETIRPAGYPGTGIPAHVHLHVIEVGRCTYPIDDIVFTDDPRLTDVERRRAERGHGGLGVATPTRAPDGTWLVTRDIRLGAGIDGCPERAAP